MPQMHFHWVKLTWFVSSVAFRNQHSCAKKKVFHHVNNHNLSASVTWVLWTNVSLVALYPFFYYLYFKVLQLGQCFYRHLFCELFLPCCRVSYFSCYVFELHLLSSFSRRFFKVFCTYTHIHIALLFIVLHILLFFFKRASRFLEHSRVVWRRVEHRETTTTTVQVFLVLSELLVELFFVACGSVGCAPFHAFTARGSETFFYRAIVQTTAEFKYTCHLKKLLRINCSRAKVSHSWRLSPLIFFWLAFARVQVLYTNIWLISPTARATSQRLFLSLSCWRKLYP